LKQKRVEGEVVVAAVLGDLYELQAQLLGLYEGRKGGRKEGRKGGRRDGRKARKKEGRKET
jgi:hypothetical protein